MNTKVDLHRFDDQVMELKEMLRKSPPESGGVLFYGSSTMANWRANDMCYKHMKGLPLTNTGFGGSTAEDALYYYRELVFPVKPSVMVYYEGANDLMNNYTPAEVIEMTHRVFEWARQDFPKIQFLIMPIKLSPALQHIIYPGTVCNELFADYASRHDDTHILDLTSFMYKEDGTLRIDTYVEDMLHHTEEGYEELATYVKPVLQKIYSLDK